MSCMWSSAGNALRIFMLFDTIFLRLKYDSAREVCVPLIRQMASSLVGSFGNQTLIHILTFSKVFGVWPLLHCCCCVCVAGSRDTAAEKCCNSNCEIIKK